MKGTQVEVSLPHTFIAIAGTMYFKPIIEATTSTTSTTTHQLLLLQKVH